MLAVHTTKGSVVRNCFSIGRIIYINAEKTSGYKKDIDQIQKDISLTLPLLPNNKKRNRTGFKSRPAFII